MMAKKSFETLTLPKDINDRCLQYYQTLYSAKTTDCPTRMETFLQKCNLTGLDLKERELLGAEISVKDIEESIRSLKNGKAAGPNGLNSEFYLKI